MPLPAELVRFLRECYRSDNRELAILDVFARKVEFRHLLSEPDELLSGRLEQAPVAADELLEVAKTARLHRAEKELLLGAVFVVGTIPEGDGSRKLCAPLLCLPVEIQPGELTPFLAVDFARQRINFPLLTLLAAALDVGAEALDAVVDQMPRAPLDIGKVGHLADLLEDAFPGLAAADLRLFPAQISDKQLRQRRRALAAARGTARLECRFGSAVLLVKRSVDTRGVLSELASLADAEQLSAPLGALLGRPAPPARRRRAHRHRVPAVLSGPQQRILANAAGVPLSLAVGPPGTGKSFTIAAVALDALRRGETVLVASKMNHAVDVVADKIEDILGIRSFVVRGGRRQYLKDLKTTLQNILSGLLPIPERTAEETRRLDDALESTRRRLARLEQALARRSRHEQSWGWHAVEGPRKESAAGRWGSRLAAAWLRSRLRSRRPYWDLMHDYQTTLESHIELSAQLLQAGLRRRLDETLRDHRPTLTRFLALLRARTAARREEIFQGIDLTVRFRAFPIWMVNLADVGRVVPLARELFDVAILDEATQCDIASCLPVLQRARRAVIVGDPRQLRHISFLARQRQERIADEAGIGRAAAALYDYRDKSILDAVSEVLPSQEQVTLLDEHFRSAPPIIEFSNREFYGGRLKVMQQRPTPAAADAVAYRRVDGRRDAAGVNREEAEALVAELLELLAREGERPAALRHTFGVLSPFRAQVDHLTERLREAVSEAQLAAHDLRVGTPYAFQGEERDVMLLSLAVDADSHPTAFRFLCRPDVFNVAITRARSRQLVFGSVAGNEPRVDALLRRFLEHLATAASAPRQASPVANADPFVSELREALEALGYRTWPTYPVAGFRVDLIVERDGDALGVDVVGYPGELSAAFELERYRLFNRAGLRLLPLPYSAWIGDRRRCLAAIEQAMG